MEVAVQQTTLSRRTWRLRVDGHVAAIWTLSAAVMLYLGLNGGGYDLVVRSRVTIVVWWAVLLGAAFAVLPAVRLSRSAWAALALLGGFVAWTAIASTWSLSGERSLQEVSRVAGYLGVLVLAVASYGDRRRALRHSVSAVACAIVVIAVLALLSRLHPGLFRGAQTTAALLPTAHGRLSWPLNYWNALGALMALALPLLLGISGSARSLGGQAAAAAAIPPVALCEYLTFSRGGAVAAAIAVLAFLVLAPERLARLGTAVVCGGASAALIAGAVHRQAIEQGLTNTAAADQGSQLLWAVVIVCAGVALVQMGIGLAARHGTPPAMLRIPVARARVLLAAALAVVVVAAVAAGAPHRLARAWHQFKQPTAGALHQSSLGRYTSVSGNERYTYWKVGLKAMGGHWAGGYGPGTYQLVWLPRAPVASYVKNAHSLYVETLVETGIVGLVLLAGFVVVVLATALRRVIQSHYEERTLAAAAAGAVAAFAVSSAVDWIWQVPVLPAALLLVAGGVLAPRAAAARVRTPRAGSPRALTWAGRLAMVAVAAACLIAIAVPLASTVALRQSQSAAAAGATGAALADARQALAIEPGSASAQLQVALVSELQKRLPAAVAAARSAIADEPQNWQTWLVLSRLQAEDGNAPGAVFALRRARSLNPQSPLF